MLVLFQKRRQTLAKEKKYRPAFNTFFGFFFKKLQYRQALESLVKTYLISPN